MIYTFPDKPVTPPKSIYFDDSSEKTNAPTELFLTIGAVVYGILEFLLTPVRALILAYSYVLSGEKVERPYKWSEI